MRGMLAGLLVSIASVCLAVDVGILDDTRLWGTGYNVSTGDRMTTMKADWEVRGAVWHPTGAITPEFLATVTVFYTSQVGMPELSEAEQAALLAWVKSGNTLIVTGDCG